MYFFHRRAAAWAATLLLLPACAVAAPLTLNQALDLAVRRSEAARSARAGVASAVEAARAAGQRPDPTLRIGVDNLPVTGTDRFSTSRDSMTMKRIGIGQEWVSADKRAARQAAADAMAGKAAVQALAATADVRLQTALAFVDAYFAGQALEWAALSERQWHEALEAAKARLASPDGDLQGVLAATRAQGMAEDEAAEVRQRHVAARAALERWIGAPVDDLDTPAGLSPVDEDAYVGRHPAVMAAQRELERARTAARVAGANRRPDWSWEVSYGQRTGQSDMVSFGVSIPLPVSPAERQDRETASKLALADQAEADLAEATRTARGEYRGIAGDARRLAERIERYRAAVVVPGQQRTAAALAGYRSNQIPLTALFEARGGDVEAQRKLLDLQRELALAQARLALKPLDFGDSK